MAINKPAAPCSISLYSPELAAALLDLLHRILQRHGRQPVGPLPQLRLAHDALGHPLPGAALLEGPQQEALAVEAHEDSR